MELQHKTIIVWIAFALASGILEAMFFNKNQRHVKVKGWNIHNWFTVARTMIATPLCLIIFFNVGPMESLLMGVILILSFPWFHDGAYYTTREILKKGTYPLYWIDKSTKTDAKISLTFTVRTTLLIIVLLIFPY